MNRSPLEKLVRRAFEAQPEQKRAFVESLGYQKPDTGYKRLYRCLRSGEDHEKILERLPEVLGLDPEVYAMAWEATRNLGAIAQLEAELERRRQEDEERLNFRPYLYVLASASRPTGSIVIYGMANLGRHRYVPLPEGIRDESLEDQKQQVGEIIRAHFRECRGLCFGMGSIVGYCYRNSYDTYLEFDTDGNFVQAVEGRPSESRSTASLKGRTLAVTPR